MTQAAQTIRAAWNKRQLKRVGSTHTDGTSIWLHNNRIAYRDSIGREWFSFAGWLTRTTADRLTELGVRTYQRKGIRYWVSPMDGDIVVEPSAWYRVDGMRMVENFVDIETSYHDSE